MCGAKSLVKSAFIISYYLADVTFAISVPLLIPLYDAVSQIKHVADICTNI